METENSRNESLFRLRGDSQGQRLLFELPPGEALVGRGIENDIRLEFAGVSRRHALLQIRPQGVMAKDLDSTNGTCIDGVRVVRAAATEGSRIAFGPVELTVEALDDGAELAMQFEARASAEGSLSELEQADTLLVSGEHDDSESSTPIERTEDVQLHFPKGCVVGKSEEMTRLYRQMADVCRLRPPVLLHGETGAGKEMLARSLHDSSAGSGAPYVVVNCAAIPENLLEAEMFGVVKGAATGVEARDGYFSRAEGGTLFLDEIGELSPSLQAKLLRVLQEGEIQPVGGASRPVDVWIIAATHANLESGNLRRDLYYRLTAGLLEVPPLRRCRDDIAPLIRHHLQVAAYKTGFELRGVTSRALEKLRHHAWPGNIRELAHIAGRLVAARPTAGIIDTEHLPEPLLRAEPDAEPEETLPDSVSLEIRPRVEALERRLIREAMIRTAGHQIRAAELLGLSRSGLAKKLRRLGLENSWATR